MFRTGQQAGLKQLPSPLEHQFQQFGLETSSPHHEPPDLTLKNPRTTISGPSSVPSRTPPLTPTALPDIYIQDYSEAHWPGESAVSQCQPSFITSGDIITSATTAFNSIHTATVGQQPGSAVENDSDFVASLRQGLEPLDDQLLTTLLTAGTFVEPEVEEQFKRN